MEHVSSSRNNECIFTDPNMENGHEKDHPLFSNFPSPFFDDISTIPILTNNLISPNKPLNIEPLFSDQSKRFEKRSVGKKDRHSKIHTAQGPRDRRMRLSLQIARQFFDLQDLLGFDKASNTIEWLFCKSNKAIQEVAGSFNPQQTNQNMSDQEIKPMDNSKEAEEIKNKESRRKNLKNNYSVKETRDQARARARERTRERLMIQLELEKSKQLFGENPKDEIYKLGLGLEDLGRPNIHNIKELGFTSCQSEPIQQELRTYHDLGESTECSTLINHNPSAGWINSCNEFSGMPEEWDADSLLTDYDNYGIFSSTSHLTGDIYEQNPNLFFMSTTNNILQFQSQNQGM